MGRGGGTGRHAGLKILFPLVGVRVRPPPPAVQVRVRIGIVGIVIIQRTETLWNYEHRVYGVTHTISQLHRTYPDQYSSNADISS